MFTNNQNENILMNYSKDGVWDIIIGLTFLIAALSIYFDFIPLVGISLLLFVPIMQSIKWAYIAPRISLEDFPPDIRQTVQRNRSLMIGTLIFTMLLGVATYLLLTVAGPTPAWLTFNVVIYTILTIIIGLLAIYTFMTRNWQYIGYGALAALLYYATDLYDLNFVANLVILGTGVLAIGIWVFYQFVKTHPILPAERQLQT